MKIHLDIAIQWKHGPPKKLAKIEKKEEHRISRTPVVTEVPDKVISPVRSVGHMELQAVLEQLKKDSSSDRG